VQRSSSFASRRRCLPLIAGAGLSLASALLPGEAGAFRRWCKTDPVIQIDGQNAHVYIAAYVANNKAARRLSTAPIRVVITIPPGVSHKKLHGNNGFGFGYDQEIAEDPALPATAEVVPVHVSVTVPMSNDEIKVKSYLVPSGHGRLRPGEEHGTANREFSYTAE
jgi:hypothetical protein